MKPLVLCFLVLAFVWGICNPTLGAFIKYEDRIDFLNNVADAGLVATNNPFETNPGGNFTLADGNGNSVKLKITKGDYDGGLKAIVADDEKLKLNPKKVAGSVFGIGFDFSAGDLEAAEIKLSGTEYNFSQSGSVTGFLGILSTDEMLLDNSLKILLEDDEQELVLDNLVIATPGAQTPEPTTICLIGFGLLGLLGIIIRQRRKDK